MIEIALLGCGRIGRVHARTLSQLAGARVAAVSDAVPEAANALAEPTGARVMDAEAIMADPLIDAVVIGTPTPTHYDLIHAAARAGKAVFCEKPVDLSAARIRECIDAVSAAGIPFLTAFNRRFDPSLSALQARVEGGEIGWVETVSITSRDPAPPPISYIESSGGLFRDMMIHDLDMARFMLPDEPVQIFATGSALVDPEIGRAGDVDTAAVILTTASGRIAQITCSRRSGYGYDQRVEVHGEKGLLRAGNRTETTVEQWGDVVASDPPVHFFLERYAEAYAAEMRHFVECLNEGRAPSPTIHDGLRAQLLADAAEESMRSGRPVSIV